MNSNLLIASTIVRESGPAAEGLSVKGLYDRLRERVSEIDCQLRLYTVISETIGNDFAKLDSVYFDYTTAVDYLEFYDYHDIPSIPKEVVPTLVSEVRFSSNLNGLMDVRKAESPFDLESSPLFKSLV